MRPPGLSPGRAGIRGRETAAAYLAAEQTVDEEDEGSLQAVDDGEEVGHDAGHRSNLENAQHPGAPQDEELGKGLERQQPGGEDVQRIRLWEGASRATLPGVSEAATQVGIRVGQSPGREAGKWYPVGK